MTLLELLRQELPKRGGWPEGADYVVQDGDGSNDVKFGAGEATVEFERRRVWVNNERSDWGINSSESYIKDITFLADDHATTIVTREQYGWDGTGLPPVGCECERSWCGDKWLPCKILFISDETVVVKLATREAAYGWREVSFRPLRTEAECAIDEMVQLSGVSTGAAKILYDAGYRKG